MCRENVIGAVEKLGLSVPKSALTLKASLFYWWWNKGGLSRETLFGKALFFFSEEVQLR